MEIDLRMPLNCRGFKHRNLTIVKPTHLVESAVHLIFCWLSVGNEEKRNDSTSSSSDEELPIHMTCFAIWSNLTYTHISCIELQREINVFLSIFWSRSFFFSEFFYTSNGSWALWSCVQNQSICWRESLKTLLPLCAAAAFAVVVNLFWKSSTCCAIDK